MLRRPGADGLAVGDSRAVYKRLVHHRQEFAVSIRPLEKTSLVDSVATALREQIVEGNLAPGSTLQIEALAREFGVSRTPVREAFSKLETEGLLTRRAGHIATVFVPTRREVCEYYDMRLALEPLAARLAVPNLTLAQESHLGKLVQRMDDFEAREWYRSNREFHHLLYEPANRPFLAATIANLVHRSDPYIHMYFATHDLLETQRGHRRILLAVAKRDADALAAAVTEHLRHVLDEIVAAIPDVTRSDRRGQAEDEKAAAS
jgi:DNA-binding GntR family transcriptional regulator